MIRMVSGAALVLLVGCDDEPVPCDDVGVVAGYCVVTLQSGDDEYVERIAGVGDVDLDGLDDVILGNPGWERGWTTSYSDGYEGRTLLVSGTTASELDSAADSAALYTLPHPMDQALSPGSGFGLAGPGDLTGDGIPDLAIAAPYAQKNIPVGVIYLVDGTLLGSVDLNEGSYARLMGEKPGDEPGMLMNTLGDNNQDGVNDLFIDSDQRDEFYIVSGTSQGDVSLGDSMARVHGWYRTNGTKWVNPGVVGDLDGDGFPDLVVPNHYYYIDTLLGPFEGEQWVDDYVVSSMTENGGGCDYGDETMFQRPEQICPVGDVNGDGLADFALIASGWGEIDDGAAFIFYGPGTTAATFDDANGKITGRTGQSLGWGEHSCSTIGDLDGDGRATWAISDANGYVVPDGAELDEGYYTPEIVWLVDGQFDGWWSIEDAGIPALSVGPEDARDDAYPLLGVTLAPGGDFDGNGSADLLVSGRSWDNTLVLLTGR